MLILTSFWIPYINISNYTDILSFSSTNTQHLSIMSIQVQLCENRHQRKMRKVFSKEIFRRSVNNLGLRRLV